MRVVVIVLALAVGVAVVILAGRPVQGCEVVGMGQSCAGQRGQRCGWRGVPSVGRGGSNAPVIVGFVGGLFGLFVIGGGCDGKLGGEAAARKGPAFVGVDSGSGGHIRFLELGCGFLRVFLVELADEVG